MTPKRHRVIQLLMNPALGMVKLLLPLASPQASASAFHFLSILQLSSTSWNSLFLGMLEVIQGGK